MYRRIINYLTRKDRLISDLIIDKYFGIYNRNGFEYVISNLYEKEVFIILVDFNDVKGMNKKHGYTKVNEIFTDLFNDLKYKFIIGRAFSGDEIFFYPKETGYGIKEIIKISRRYGLELDDVYGMCNIKNINNNLNRLLDKLHTTQQINK